MCEDELICKNFTMLTEKQKEVEVYTKFIDWSNLPDEDIISLQLLYAGLMQFYQNLGSTFFFKMQRLLWTLNGKAEKLE